ncbi:hypothetical protein [Nocardioides nanhaiensis]|uniref:Uncharacterized protein n=1 Tax=Nocardioides nanhaiensis TaxID=1476871 RepID=A0ABP8VRP2_9ACTN
MQVDDGGDGDVVVAQEVGELAGEDRAEALHAGDGPEVALGGEGEVEVEIRRAAGAGGLLER